MKTSTISLKRVLEDSISKRIDAEFFSPEYIKSLNMVKNKQYDKIGNIVSVLTDYHANGSYEILKDNVKMYDEPNYALMIRTIDFENNDFTKDVKYIDKHAYTFLRKTQMHGGEVIINKIGNAGRVYLMPILNRPVSLGMNIFMLRFKEGYNASFIFTYLNTTYGKNLIKRRITGAVPLSIDKDSVREVIVPILNNEFQNKIANIVHNSQLKNIDFKSTYIKIYFILNNNLGLNNFKPCHQLTFKKKLSDINLANRFDAEYFQPKYDEIIEKIKSYSNGWDKLSNIIQAPKKGIEVGSEEYCEQGIPFVRVSNLSQHEINNNNMQYISEEHYNSIANAYQPKKGEILLSKDGTPGIAYYLSETPQKMISSGGILRLIVNNKEYLPEYLTFVLNSIVVQMQVERVSSGALIKHWLVDEIQNTLIPKLEMNKQIEIVEQLKEATKLRKQSKQLLEIAKRGVEIAIEENEDMATEWINEQLLKLAINLN